MDGGSTTQFILLPEFSKRTILDNTMDVAILLPALDVLTAVPREKVVACAFVIQTASTQALNMNKPTFRQIIFKTEIMLRMFCKNHRILNINVLCTVRIIKYLLVKL